MTLAAIIRGAVIVARTWPEFDRLVCVAEAARTPAGQRDIAAMKRHAADNLKRVLAEEKRGGGKDSL